MAHDSCHTLRARSLKFQNRRGGDFRADFEWRRGRDACIATDETFEICRKAPGRSSHFNRKCFRWINVLYHTMLQNAKQSNQKLMKKLRYFNSPVISRREEITSASQPAAEDASRLRPLRYEILRNALLTKRRSWPLITTPQGATALCRAATTETLLWRLWNL